MEILLGMALGAGLFSWINSLLNPCLHLNVTTKVHCRKCDQVIETMNAMGDV